MAGSLGAINTNISLPNAPGAGASTSDYLQYEKDMMLFQMAYDAAKTGISTAGDAMASAANTKPQTS